MGSDRVGEGQEGQRIGWVKIRAKVDVYRCCVLDYNPYKLLWQRLIR